MNLAAETVELRLDRAAPEPFDDGFGVRQSLCQHHADRRADMRLEFLEASQAALAQSLERQAEIGAEIVCPLYHGPRLPGVRLQAGHGLDDGGSADAEPHAAHYESRDVERRKLRRRPE